MVVWEALISKRTSVWRWVLAGIGPLHMVSHPQVTDPRSFRWHLRAARGQEACQLSIAGQHWVGRGHSGLAGPFVLPH